MNSSFDLHAPDLNQEWLDDATFPTARRDEHYDTILRRAVANPGGCPRPGLHPETRIAWTEALTLAADTMKRGAAATQVLKQEMLGK